MAPFLVHPAGTEGLDSTWKTRLSGCSRPVPRFPKNYVSVPGVCDQYPLPMDRPSRAWEAIKNMEVSQLWSVLYFFMLLLLGMGSMLGNTAAILTPLTDSKVISSHLPKEAISGQWESQ